MSLPLIWCIILCAVNDIKNAVQSVASYMLFDPGDEVMQQNLVYYRFYRERWHLEEDDFNPRPVRTGMVVGLKITILFWLYILAAVLWDPFTASQGQYDFLDFFPLDCQRHSSKLRGKKN